MQINISVGLDRPNNTKFKHAENNAFCLIYLFFFLLGNNAMRLGVLSDKIEIFLSKILIFTRTGFCL